MTQDVVRWQAGDFGPVPAAVEVLVAAVQVGMVETFLEVEAVSFELEESVVHSQFSAVLYTSSQSLEVPALVEQAG